MRYLSDGIRDVKNTLRAYLASLRAAREEGIAKRNLGYVHANPEWIDHAIRVFEEEIRVNETPNPSYHGGVWNRHRRFLSALRDHLRHFDDADLSWSEILADTAALRTLQIAMDVYTDVLLASDSDLDSWEESDFRWAR